MGGIVYARMRIGNGNRGNMRSLRKFVVVAMILSSMLLFWGCRQVWRSLGASWSPQVIDVAEVQPGTPLADRHVDLENFLPVITHTFQKGSTLYVPLAPFPADGFPEDEFDWQAAARDTRLFATIDDDETELLDEAIGLVMGTAEYELDRELRNQLKRELRVRSVPEIEVVELGRGPSVLWGLTLIVGGLLAMVAVGFFGVKTLGE